MAWESGPGNNGNEGVLHTPELKPHCQMKFNVIPRTPILGSPTNRFGLVWLGWVLWHINHCRLFNAKSSLYIYIKYI